MADKPEDLPRWASDDENALTTDPPSGMKDIGWTPGRRPGAEVFNWWQNLVYKWIDYLKDGVFSGAHSFDDDVSIDGDTTVGGNLDVDGDVSVGGDFEATDDHFYHGEVTRWLPLTHQSGLGSGDEAWFVAESTNVYYSHPVDTAGNDHFLAVDIPLAIGDRLKEVRFHVYDADPAYNIVCSVYAATVEDGEAIPVASLLGTESTSGYSTDMQRLDVNVTDTTMIEDRNIKAIIETDAGTVNHRVFGISYVYDRPKPE